MPTLTLDQIEERAAAFHAIHNAPKAQARRSVFELSSLLADLSAADRADTLNLLREEVLHLPVTA